jgi:hypothetical protein
MIEKPIVPCLLFMVLSPGVFTAMKTSVQDVILNALIFIAAYWAIARVLGVALTKTDLIAPAILFVLLSPGLLLTIPPGPGGLFMSNETSLMAVSIHTVVFAAAFSFMRTTFPKVY